MRIFTDAPVESHARQLCGRMPRPVTLEPAGEATLAVVLVADTPSS